MMNSESGILLVFISLCIIENFGLVDEKENSKVLQDFDLSKLCLLKKCEKAVLRQTLGQGVPAAGQCDDDVHAIQLDECAHELVDR